MIKILKKDATYRREQDFSDLSFWNCTKITTQDPKWTWKGTMIQRYCIILVSDGNIELTIGKKDIVNLKSGAVAVIVPNTPISAIEKSTSSTFLMITFSCDDFIFFDLHKKYIQTQVSSDTVSLFYQLSSYIIHSSKPYYYYESMLIMILDEIKQHIIAEPEKHIIYNRVCKYISTHIGEDLTVTKISKAMEYHPDYLSRIIRESYNTNIQQLIIEERLETAKNLLRMTNFSCEKIALHIGLNSGNKFVKFFKYHTHQTPSAYRNKYQVSL